MHTLAGTPGTRGFLTPTMPRPVFIALILLLAAGSSLAQDIDQDGMPDDQIVLRVVPDSRPEADVAIIDSGSWSQWYFLDRLEGLGFTPTYISRDSEFDELSQYDLVLLPMHTASGSNLEFFQSMAQGYIDYVAAGGHLYVGQPNPYQNGAADISWVPYPLVVINTFTVDDCPATIADLSHCIAEGITGADLPTAIDTVVELDPAWLVVAAGSQSNNPSVIIADHGEGRVLVEFGQPNLDTGFCPYTEVGFSNMIMCLLSGESVRTEAWSWSAVKSAYR